jgi:hypothetical protein
MYSLIVEHPKGFHKPQIAGKQPSVSTLHPLRLGAARLHDHSNIPTFQQRVYHENTLPPSTRRMIMKTGAAAAATTTLMMMESRSDVTHLCIIAEFFRCRRYLCLNKLDSIHIYLFIVV